MGWAEAIALGAIISPPDAVSATAIGKRLGIPRRVVTILEGESLVNDATALVLYRVAVGAAVSGMFTLGGATARVRLCRRGRSHHWHRGGDAHTVGAQSTNTEAPNLGLNGL